ncbi:MAG: head maturation protease, ClpP-related, partial [Candidatus Woesearchaeota archaeon]
MSKKIWEVKNSKDKDVGELLIMGDIEDHQWWEEDVTPKLIMDDLNSLGDIKKLKVKISSYGGSVFAGINISNLILDYADENNVEVTGYVMGIAASIASIIACSLPNLVMYPSSMLMIHNPMSSIYMGNSSDFRKEADTLDDIRESLIATYQRKTNLTKEEIIEMLDGETFLTADEALSYGFCNEIKENEDINATIEGNNLIMNGIKFNMKKFKNMPDRLVAKYKNNNKGVNSDMPFKEFKTEDDYNNAVVDIKNQHRTELLEDEEFVNELRNGYVKVEDVLAKFEDLEVDDLDKLVSSVKDIKANYEKVQADFENYKADVENDKLFASRKETLENAGIEVNDEEKEDILALTDYAINKMV